MIKLDDFRQARERMRGIVHTTPLDRSVTFSRMTGADVYLKLENLQKTGSFKIRGAYHKISVLNSVLNSAEKKTGVIAASAGNHAQGVAFAAHKAGIPACIVMPETAPFSKIGATRNYGANVVLHGQVYDEACQKALEIQECSGAVFIHAFDDPDVVIGQGTVGLEIMDDLPDAGVVFVPLGGGGLASGIALCAKMINPRVKIIGVEAEGAACYKASLQAGRVSSLTSVATIADGIAVKRPGEYTFPILRRYLDDIVTVDDEETASTIMLLLERAKLLVEGAGAVALAAAIYRKYPLKNEKVVAVVSGGNIDVNLIALIIEKGLVKTGRHIRLSASMPDKPGNLQAFLQVIAQERGNIISINHDRARASLPVDEAFVEAVVETMDHEHGKKIVRALRQKGFKADFTFFDQA